MRPAGDARALSLAIRLLRHVPRAVGGFEAAEIMGARTSELRLLPRVPKALAVRPAEEGDTRLLERFFERAARTPRRLSSADDCLLALGDGEIQALEWVRWGPSEYAEDKRRLGVRFKVPAGSCWLHNGGNVSRQMMGPWGMLMGRLRAFLETRGVENAFMQIDPSNVYSVACHESLGFRRLGRLAALRVLRGHVVAFRLEQRPWGRVSRGELDLAELGV